MHRTVNGANAIVALRCAIQGNRFDDHWRCRTDALDHQLSLTLQCPACREEFAVMVEDKTQAPRSREYWRANLKLMALLLAIWFTVSFGFGILLAERLNEIRFFGFKFGFWWAQQGSIYVFVILIFVYANIMRRLDRKYGVDDDTPR